MKIPRLISKQFMLYLSLTSFFLVFTIIIYAPLEMFLGNINSFEFGLDLIWWIPLGLAIAVMGLLLGLGFAVNLIFKRIGTILYGAFLFAIGLAFYIQGNFAGLQLGVMNGAKIDFSEYTSQAFANVFLWVFIILAVFIFLYFLKSRGVKPLLYASAILIGMQSVALFVSISSVDVKTDVSVVSDKGLFEVSDNKNVIVCVLDMFDQTYFEEILKTESTLKDNLDGFTYFTNSVGSASSTKYALGMILTGQVLMNDGKDIPETTDIAYSKTDFYDVLAENHYRIDMYTTHCLSQKLLQKSYNYTELTKSSISSYKTLAKDLYQLALCKYAPDVLKPFVWMNGTEFEGIVKRNIAAYNKRNSRVADALRNSSFELNNDANMFKFIHLSGAHPPYSNDGNANRVPENSATALSAGRGSLQVAFEYMEEMKKLGVYDDSFIIICADHGYYDAGVLTNPILLVKRAGDSGEMKVSDVPVSHMDFHATIMTDLGLNQDHKYGKSVFEIEPGEQRHRMFYQFRLGEHSGVKNKIRLIEYSVADESNLRRSFRLTDREISENGDIIPHKINCAYCLSGAYDNEDPNAPGDAQFIHTRK